MFGENTENSDPSRDPANHSGINFSDENPYHHLLTKDTTQHTSDKKSEKTPSKQWADLFPKLRRGRATYSTYSPREQIKSKNDNALVIDISQMLSSFNEITASLYENAKNDIVAIKQHLKKGSRSQLEIIFANHDLLKEYAVKGVRIFNRTYTGYIPTDARRSFLSVKVRNVPLGDKNKVSELIQEAFEDIGKVVSIKPLLIEGTPYLTDQ